MLTDLPWLPRPGDAERAALDEVASADELDFVALRMLLGHGWPEGALRRAGKRIAEALQSASSEQLAAAGIARFRLLVIAAHTFVHMREALIASALQHGVALELT